MELLFIISTARFAPGILFSNSQLAELSHFLEPSAPVPICVESISLLHDEELQRKRLKRSEREFSFCDSLKIVYQKLICSSYK